jgi:hypothetical protein
MLQGRKPNFLSLAKTSGLRSSCSLASTCLPLFSVSLRLCERHKLFLSPVRCTHSSRKDREGVQLNITLVLGLSRTLLLRSCLPLFSAAQRETNLLSLSLGYLLALTVRNQRKRRPVIRASLFRFISVSCQGGTVYSLSYSPRIIQRTCVPFVKKLRAFGGRLTLPVPPYPVPLVSSPRPGVRSARRRW